MCFDVKEGKNVKKKDTDLLRKLFEIFLLKDTCTEVKQTKQHNNRTFSPVKNWFVLATDMLICHYILSNIIGVQRCSVK